VEQPLNPPPSQWPGDGRVVIAFSGGPDSLYLLHQVLAAGTDRAIICLHVDHGLDTHSHVRARRAVELARAAGCDCTAVRVAVDQHGSPEASARRARYRAIEDFIQTGDVVLTAHHSDDQVETALMRLLRGAGPVGLAGMPRQRRLGSGWLLRPLLDCSRAEIERWIDRHRLEPIRDPANDTLQFDRNVVRHELLPLIRERWKGVDRAISRSARLCRGAAANLERMAEIDLATQTETPVCLRLAGTRHWNAQRLGDMLRHWCHRQQLDAPPGRRIETFIEQMRQGARDRQPQLEWDQGVIRAWRRRLWMERQPAPARSWQLDWTSGRVLELPEGIGSLELHGAAHPPLPITVRAGQAGDRLQPAGQRHRRKVTQLLAEAGVPPWQRDLWPRLWLGESLAGLGDRWMAGELAQTLKKHKACIVWHTTLHCG
jgi:tRNA(Ile)-lysidine synthase